MNITDNSGLNRTIRQYDPLYIAGRRFRFYGVLADFATYGLFQVCNDEGQILPGSVLVRETEFVTGFGG